MIVNLYKASLLRARAIFCEDTGHLHTLLLLTQLYIGTKAKCLPVCLN
jgi:hypothetical protein